MHFKIKLQQQPQAFGVSMISCKVCWGPTIIVLNIEIAAGLRQDAQTVVVPILTCNVCRRQTIVVPYSEVVLWVTPYAP